MKSDFGVFSPWVFQACLVSFLFLAGFWFASGCWSIDVKFNLRREKTKASKGAWTGTEKRKTLRGAGLVEVLSGKLE